MFHHAQSVVFIDANVSDAQHLVSGVLPGVAVKVLATDADGIAQITNYLEAYPASTVHIVSHGAPGVLYLGNTQLNLTNLENHAQALRSWFSPQTANPTLLLYGCNVAAGDAGEELIEKLHRLTGAGIAASRQVIGQGYWSLEVNPTQTTARAPFSAPVLASWAGKLAPVINNLSNSSYTEQGPAFILDNDITFSGGTNYQNGYVEFSLGTATSFDFLTLATDGSPATGNGQVSIVGNDVYLGDGSTASIIGNVDSTFDGQNGQKLRINFSTGFENGDFDLGTAGSTTITGWTSVDQRVEFGSDLIAGLLTPTDTTFPANNSDQGQNTPVDPGTFSTVLSGTQNDGGGNSVQLTSSGITTQSGYDIVRGPYIYSNSTVQLSVGDQVSFEWQAQGGDDAYDVYGYIVDVNTNNIVTILNETGSSASAATTWATETVSITQAGEYRFVFVAGTFDFTGGTVAGAQLFIDDVVVTQAIPPVTLSDSVLSTIAQRVQYNNTSETPEPSKTLTVSVENNLGETASSTATIAITSVNDPLTGGVTLSGTAQQGAVLTATSTLADPDSLGTLNYEWQQSIDGITWTAIAAATANTFTLTQAQVGQFVRSQVSYTDGGGTAESVLSNATASAVANVNDGPTGSVTIDGTIAQGQTLTANTSTLADLDGLGTLSYQWKQSSDGGTTWSNIDGATGNTFSPRNAQVSQLLQVAVSYVDGQGTSESLTSAPTSGSVVKFNATSDFNGDGSVDIFWRHQNVGESVFWLMDNVNFSGGDVLSPAVTDVNWDIKAVGDLNGDGNPDLVWQNKATNQAAVWLMDGVSLDSGALLPNDAAAGWKVVESGDFDGNGNDDILWRDANTGELAVWYMDGTDLLSGEFITLNPGLDWEVGAVGDFTGDGKTDIFWENRVTGANAFWEMNGATFVNGYQTATAETIWQAQGAADFNQDGDLDLLWHNPGTGENALWLMDGMNLTAGVALPTTEVSWNPTV